MDVWWTYRPADLLMFSPRIYWRLFESINAAWWPLQPVLLVTTLAMLIAAVRSAPREGEHAGRVAATLAGFMLAASCGLVAWAFLHQRLAPILPVADGYALAFGVQSALLAALGTAAWVTPPAVATGARRVAGLALIGWALWLHPLLSMTTGRPWTQAEVVGLAPDPTAIVTVGWLLLHHGTTTASRWLLRLGLVVPLAWCLVSGATLWTMGSVAHAAVLLAAALVAGAVLLRR